MQALSLLALFCVCFFTFSTNRRSLETQWKATRDEQASPSAMTSTKATTETNHTSYAKPLLHQMAPSLFAMNADTGLIDLPAQVDTVIIDVGARESDYLGMLEARATKNAQQPQTIALILVDPLPDSIIPLQKRVAEYTMRNKNPRWLHEHYTNRVFAVNAAMADEEGQLTFNIGSGPACSSLLNTSAENTFWCAKALRKIPVLVYTLRDLLALISKRPTITSMHLKVDAEGADLIVLKGARDAITRFDSIIIECKAGSPSDGVGNVHENECYYDQARTYMQTVGFDSAGAESQGGDVNAYFWKRNQTMIPQFLTQKPIVHKNLYTFMKA